MNILTSAFRLGLDFCRLKISLAFRKLLVALSTLFFAKIHSKTALAWLIVELRHFLTVTTTWLIWAILKNNWPKKWAMPFWFGVRILDLRKVEIVWVCTWVAAVLNTVCILINLIKLCRCLPTGCAFIDLSIVSIVRHTNVNKCD